MGAGIGQTVIVANGLFVIEASVNPASFRISNFTFQGPGGEANEAIKITNYNSTSFTKGWRIDHNRFLYSNAGETMNIYGLTWGLIDHNTWDTTPGGAPALPLYMYGYLNSETGTGNSLYGTAYWNRPMNLGSDEAIYFENNTVNFASGIGQPFVFDMDFGGAIVMRYNVVHNAYIQTHSARTNGRGGFKYEVYNNVFTDSNARFALMRSGSGVFFNNQVNGTQKTIDIDSQHIPQRRAPRTLQRDQPLRRPHRADRVALPRSAGPGRRYDRREPGEHPALRLEQRHAGDMRDGRCLQQYDVHHAEWSRCRPGGVHQVDSACKWAGRLREQRQHAETRLHAVRLPAPDGHGRRGRYASRCSQQREDPA
jgi:hypothetical protein